MSTPSERPSEPTSDPAAQPHAGEDVLGPELAEEDAGARADSGPSATRPPDRSPWSRRRDRVIAATLAVVWVATAVVLWSVGDNQATTQQTASGPPSRLQIPAAVPGSLAERWRAPSEATPEPVAEAQTVVTGSDGTVSARDPLTGDVRWSYSRDVELCTASIAWGKAVAVYRKDLGCSEVTQLALDSGRRTAQRNGDAEAPTRLVVDDSHVTTTGTRLINTWRSDLVKTLEYGRVPAPVNPERQPRSGCSYSSVAAGADKVGVLEHCPRETGARLTVLDAAGEEADTPEQVFSALLPEMTAQLVAMSDERIAVALPERRELHVYGYDGRRHAVHELSVPAQELQPDPELGKAATSVGRENVYWFTGSHTVALSREDLSPRWVVEGTLGAGTVFAREYVLPINGGLAVLDERTGETTRTVAVDRQGHDGPVELAATGPVLLEQRGPTVVALR